MYKSLNEVLEVISLGKPIEVVDVFLESYLQGVEYAKWAEGKDLEEVETIVVGEDEDGNDIVHTRFVHVYQNVEVDIEAWKRNNYAILRAPHYPNIAELADALVKGDDKAIEAYKAKCLAVKERFPK